MLELINLDRYPIHDSAACQPLIEKVRQDLALDGCAVISRFLSPAGIQALLSEADSVAANAFHSSALTNVYFTGDDTSLPECDPRRRFFKRSNAFVPADNFSDAGALRSIRNFPAFDPFIQSCLQEEKFYRYADPLADVIVNIAEEGSGFPWHFDTNNFTVTLAIQNAEQGGEFEYAPGIRNHADGSENFSAVAEVLDGTSGRVRHLPLQPGDLQLFRGRYSLHRVAPLKGKRRRYVAIFSYVEEANMVGSVERTRQLYGRVLPIHHQNAGVRNDAYID